MCVLVVRVMDVFVRVFQRFVQVLMGMVLSQVQPHTQAHQHCGNPKCCCGRF